MNHCDECKHWNKRHALDSTWGECGYLLDGLRKNGKSITYADTPCILHHETAHDFGCIEWAPKKQT